MAKKRPTHFVARVRGVSSNEVKIVSIYEVEKKLNDILSFNYANEHEESEGETEALEKLIRSGVELGSPYATKLLAMRLYWGWRNLKDGSPCPDDCLKMLIESAKQGFGECMWKLAEDKSLPLTDIERYAYRKLSKFQLEDLPYFKLNEEQKVAAEKLYESLAATMPAFYPTPEEELLIGSGN